MVAYRAFYVLNWVFRAYNERGYTHHLLLYATAAVHVGVYVVFIVDRKCRCGNLCFSSLGLSSRTKLTQQVFAGFFWSFRFKIFGAKELGAEPCHE